MKKPTLGLSMIVKNEEKVIGRCLDCCKGLFDEIVIVDTGSTDKTKEIVSKYTDKIYDFEWIYDFAAARNYSFSKNTCDFIMWLDADDIIDDENLNKLKELKKRLDLKKDAYRMWYNCVQDKNGNPTISNTRGRILRNTHKDRWVGKIHETIPMKCEVQLEDIVIVHKKEHVNDPDRNLIIYQKMEERKDHFSIRDLTLYSTELMTHKKLEEALKIIDKIFKRKIIKNEKFYYDKAIVNKYRIYTHLKKSIKERKKILTNHLNTFLPTPIVCCELGNLFYEENDLYTAKHWFDTALYVARQYPDDEVLYNGFIEFYQLSAIHYQLGDLETAVNCAREGLKLRPNDPGIRRNYEDFTKMYCEKIDRNKMNK